MPRGLRGSMGTVGGIGRTYGLHRHFEKEENDDMPRAKLSRARLGRVARYLSPYKFQWCIILVCICITAGLNVLPPLAVGVILDRAIPQGDTVLLGILSGAMVILAVLIGLLGVLQQTLTAKAGTGIIFDIRRELFRHLQQMSLRFYTTNRSGEIVSRINNDVNAVQNVATNTIVTIATNCATLVATATAMFSMNWKLTLVAVAIVPAFYIPSRIVGKIRRRLSTRTQEMQGTMLTFLNERLHVGGTLLTHIYGQRGPEEDTFSETSGRVRDLNVRQAVVGRWLFMILSVFSAVGPALVYWYGGYQVIQEALTPGMLVAFAALLTLLYRPLVQLATVYVDIQASLAVFERIFEYLDLEPEVCNPPEPVFLKNTRGHIRFDSVGFEYPVPVNGDVKQAEDARREKTAQPFSLRNISFEIEPGEQVALVGPSGAGKTTITYLIPRFYDPDTGRISLDGHDLRDLDMEDLRRHIGMVTQETFLFHATIRENLLYARPEAGEQQMIEACLAANIHDFIQGLPEGYGTLVGERGFRLSGGEKQRLSIARALLKDPEILILDEATSNLDATSEHLIQTAMETLLSGRTSLIIAHRLSTILSSDKIVVMDRGQRVGIGTHDALLKTCGLYRRLFNQQFGRVLAQNGGST